MVEFIFRHVRNSIVERTVTPRVTLSLIRIFIFIVPCTYDRKENYKNSNNFQYIFCVFVVRMFKFIDKKMKNFSLNKITTRLFVVSLIRNKDAVGCRQESSETYITPYKNKALLPVVNNRGVGVGRGGRSCDRGSGRIAVYVSRLVGVKDPTVHTQEAILSFLNASFVYVLKGGDFSLMYTGADLLTICFRGMYVTKFLYEITSKSSLFSQLRNERISFLYVTRSAYFHNLFLLFQFIYTSQKLKHKTNTDLLKNFNIHQNGKKIDQKLTPRTIHHQYKTLKLNT